MRSPQYRSERNDKRSNFCLADVMIDHKELRKDGHRLT